jgi:hypothetical protein
MYIHINKIIPSIIKKRTIYFSTLSSIFYGCTNIHIRIDEKKKKKSMRKRIKNIFSSSNHTTTSVAATVVSSIIRLLHRRLLLSCTHECMCLDWRSLILFVSLVSSSLFSVFFTTSQSWRKKALLVVTHSFIHLFTHLTLDETTYKEREKKNNIPVLDWNAVIYNQ